MTDPTGKGFFDDVTDELFDVIEEHGDGIVEVRGEQYEEVDENGERITIRTSDRSVVDPDSGAKIVRGDAEITGQATESQVGGRVRITTTSVDSGTLLGDDVRIGLHGPEVDGYGSVGDDKTGAGGHLDLAGGDVRVGDDGTHVQAGVSIGWGLGLEAATGEDSDGDGYGEWGMRGEGGPVSAAWRFEPGAVADAAGEYYDEAAAAASTAYDEITADEHVDEFALADGVDQTPGAGLGPPDVYEGTAYDETLDEEMSYDETLDEEMSYDETSYETSYEEMSYDETSYEGTAYDETSYEGTAYDETSYGSSTAEDSSGGDTYEVSDDVGEG
jgi:hypothetical protein